MQKGLLFLLLIVTGAVGSYFYKQFIAVHNFLVTEPAAINLPEQSDMGPIIPSPKPKPDAWVDTAVAEKWLAEHDFDRVDQYLEELYRQVQEDPTKEYQLAWAFFGLESAISEDDADLKAWLAAKPDSVAAQILLGGVLVDKAWQIRGTSYSYKIGQERMARFGEGLAEAAEVLRQALKHQSDHPVAHFHYVTSQCGRGGAACLLQLIPLLDEQAPNVFFARRNLMMFMKPKWGGNYGLIKQYQTELTPRVEQKPYLKALLGFDEYAVCEARLRVDKDYEKAAEACKKAWLFGPDDLYFKELFNSLFELKQFDEIADAMDALQARFPSSNMDDWAKYYAKKIARRIHEFRKEKNFDESFRAAEAAIRMAPEIALPYLERGAIYFDQNNYAAAEEDFRRGIALEPEFYYGYAKLAYFLFNMERSGEMVPLLENFITLHQDEPKAYYELARGYTAKRDAVSVYKNHKIACDMGYEPACPLMEDYSRFPVVQEMLNKGAQQ